MFEWLGVGVDEFFISMFALVVFLSFVIGALAGTYGRDIVFGWGLFTALIIYSCGFFYIRSLEVVQKEKVVEMTNINTKEFSEVIFSRPIKVKIITEKHKGCVWGTSKAEVMVGKE